MVPKHFRTPTPTSTPTPARSASSTSPARLTGPISILAAALLWGTTGTVSSLAPTGAAPAAVGCAGLALGGLLLFASSRAARRLPRVCTRRERGLLLLGALAVAGYPVSFYPAVARTGVAVATVIALGSAPAFAGLLAWLTRSARPTVRWACATTTALLGCIVLVLGPQLTGTAATVDVPGALLAAVAGLSYAVYALIGAKLIEHGHPSAAVMGTMFGAAAVLVLPVLVLSDERWMLTVRGAAVALHLAVVTTFLAYRFYGYGLRHTTAQVATTLTLAEPAVAALLGVTALGEHLPTVSWYGLAILATGMAVLTVPNRRRRRRR